MPEKEEKITNVSLTCVHCNEKNKVAHADFKSAMLGNHFFKMMCTKCGKRTMFMYSMFSVPYEYGDTPEKILEKIDIPDGTVNITKQTQIDVDI